MIDEEFKRIRRRFQGKYFKGQELEGKPTYVFIRKVEEITRHDPEWTRTFADVLGYKNNNLVFWQNRGWFFGKKYIRLFEYKEIKKSEFVNAVTDCGFKNEKPKNFLMREYKREK